MSDPNLFGHVFSSPSFWTWKCLAKVIDGIPLTEKREIDLFELCTGRKYDSRSVKAFRRIFILAGRRAGKDRFLSSVVIWRCALCCDWRKYQSPGEGSVAILLGRDKKQAAILRRYCQGLLEAPLLKKEVTRTTGEITEFRNGASLEISSNDVGLVRGRSAIAVLGSECCFWKSDEKSASSDEEVVAAAEPSMSMCPDHGVLILGSSVYRKRGFMYRQYKELHGNDEAESLVWFAPSHVMNPRLPQSVVDKALQNDKARASAEYLNIFRDDVSDFVPAELIEACIDLETFERPPQGDIKYFAWCDAAGGLGSDSMTLALAHRQTDRRRAHCRARSRKRAQAAICSACSCC
jgi:hypothetical protein